MFSAVILLLFFHCAVTVEVLPPIAFFNRTQYAPLITYTAKPHLALGILSDIQYADRDEIKRRHFRKSISKLSQAIDEMNANRSHLDLVIHLGDLVDGEMERYLPILQPLLAKIKFPFYQVLGNHDFLATDEKKFSKIHQMLGMPSRYYSLNAGPQGMYRLVILDGNDIALYSTVTGSVQRNLAEKYRAQLRRRRAKNAQIFNGAIGSEQITWLKMQLQEACDQHQRVLIFLHHPLRPRDEPTNLWNDLEIVPILTSFSCVIAVLNGHAHKFLYDFHYTQYRAVHFITFGGMVQSPFTSYGFVDVYDTILHIHGLVFGRPIDLRYNVSLGAKLNVVVDENTAEKNSVFVQSAPPVFDGGTSSGTWAVTERDVEDVFQSSANRAVNSFVVVVTVVLSLTLSWKFLRKRRRLF